MGLLQNGFKDICGVFRMYGAGLSNGALPQQLPANYALTGMRRNLTAGEGIVDDSVGLPMGYLAGGSYQLPQKPGQMSSRAFVVAIEAHAEGVAGLPGSGAATLSISNNAGTMLPEDTTSPLRSGSASFTLSAEATGELKVSGAGSATLALVVGSAELVGILNASGHAEIALTVNSPILGAIADGQGESTFSMGGSATALPEDDSSPLRSGSAVFSVTGSGRATAIGHMEGNALPYTELSPQSLADAVWSYTK